MTRFSRLAPVAIGLSICLAVHPVMAGTLEDLYNSQTIVNGKYEKNRQSGFKRCLDAVLVRVSGDQRLPAKPEMTALRDKAGSFVAGFRYRDRMEGIPNHDDQGTYDRPHDLSCQYKPAEIDPVLASLGSRPWLAERPQLAVFLTTERGTMHYALDADDDRGVPMRESFGNAAVPLAMQVAFPTAAQLSRAGLDDQELRNAEMTKLDTLAKKTGADQALSGSLVWSDKELGWIADWRLAAAGKTYIWQVRGVGFDEAFRVAIRGAAQILSGNGQPE
ncbi:DUF2066 domain-containing protein [Mesorhizobium sp. M7A.T.Ca.TU.009.01.3.2]|uniref:DUF2066 domain-containing protein n=1 Tax=Mesorhizobium sp. M7A.T.Ca.US.000.02.1.1 TaxID=2496792 RepID=UPI000FCAE228|nr:DUF2066 domain-containing protein [Mesorhizobium sp. M7A.T.Ca.US.000.02.1.1]RUT80782.1 DUF2066 domain-containing protein [Mesorhizobium sp. M7A.T.Ca.US.000.02.1.1]RUU00432.1 DUF2066 domain-containing protein [Mesorhizobium sp. M7A.T.Ca.TU.009.02.1.1]RUU09717.1 DUF2066 domain-containing protein [Mesorhizobium sp. M7A.T.Ca.TU.009.01.3.2]RUV00882.1 DUF2066 domain-containing protein [Mesorhizobium sp. M7A.T.Ca.TU.009.01.3.1]